MRKMHSYVNVGKLLLRELPLGGEWRAELGWYMPL